MKTNHFSPYVLIDKLTSEEKGVQIQDNPGPKTNVTTGDQAVHVAMAGLGMNCSRPWHNATVDYE